MAKLEKTIIIKCKQGLHARPAAMFVQIAHKYTANVMIRKGAEQVNGKSIMGILMLGADHGSEVLMSVDGEDAEKMFAELEAYLVKEE